MTSTTIQVPVM